MPFFFFSFFLLLSFSYHFNSFKYPFFLILNYLSSSTRIIFPIFRILPSSEIFLSRSSSSSTTCHSLSPLCNKFPFPSPTFGITFLLLFPFLYLISQLWFSVVIQCLLCTFSVFSFLIFFPPSSSCFLVLLIFSFLLTLLQVSPSTLIALIFSFLSAFFYFIGLFSSFTSYPLFPTYPIFPALAT